MTNTIEELNAAVEGDTVATVFLRTVEAMGDRVALRERSADDGWAERTFADYADQVGQVAASLRAAGVLPGDRVVLMMRNIADFHVVDLATVFCGATPISIYNSSSPEQVAYLAGHCEAKVAVVEDDGFLERFLKVRDELPALGEIVNLATSRSELFGGHGIVDLRESAEHVDQDTLATVIYTSGTTGPPKGVMINNYNVVYTAESLRRCFGGESLAGKRLVSYLPMAHIAERMTSHYLQALQGYEITSCPDPSQIPAYLRDVRPNIVFGVPRVWEKIHAGITAAIAADPEKKAKFDEGVAAAIPIALDRSWGRSTPEQDAIKPGTVGPAIPGCEVTLADDGEIICRGGNVFQGYLNAPDKTAETLQDGWLHSGDIGVMDEDGYVRIVDRKKELIITAGGKNISPANLEAALKLVPLVGQACAIGDQRPFVAALLVLDPEVAPAWARANGLGELTLPELAEHPAVIEQIERGVAEVMAGFNNAERVKKVKVLGTEWLPDSEELTPTSKLKRRGVHARYAAEIESLYS
jgi:long-chain acyl-CoA synthetase